MRKKLLQPTFLAVAALSMVITGCKDEEKEKALAEAEKARVELQRVKARLAKAETEIADLNEALETVKKNRDELARQVDELSRDKGSALASSEQSQQAIRNLNARTSEQDASAAVLQKQNAELSSLIESQERTIAEQEATIAELLKNIELLEGSTENPPDKEQGQTDVNDGGL